MNIYLNTIIHYALTGGNRIVNSELFQNLILLIKDLTSAATIGLVILAALVLVAYAIQRVFHSMNDRDVGFGTSFLGKLVIWLIIGASASGLLNLFLSYFNS